MLKILFDTNVILDIGLKILPHFLYTAKLFDLIDENKIVAHITATTITDIYYISGSTTIPPAIYPFRWREGLVEGVRVKTHI